MIKNGGLHHCPNENLVQITSTVLQEPAMKVPKDAVQSVIAYQGYEFVLGKCCHTDKQTFTLGLVA